MNAKIKLSILSLAGVAMLASCGAKGESLTRAQAEAELDSYSNKVPAATKLTYKDQWENAEASYGVFDTAEVYAYRKNTVTSNNTTTTTEYFVYKSGENYLMGSSDGTTKKYATVSQTAASTAITTALAALTTYANNQIGGTSYWLKGFDKTDAYFSSNPDLDKTNTSGYANIKGSSTVAGYLSAESYTKYAEGELTVDVTAQYPAQADMIAMGGEHCIYAWKNYQLTRLYNNYQKYEETFDWENADTSKKSIDANTWTAVTGTVDITAYAVIVTAGLSYLGHYFAD